MTRKHQLKLATRAIHAGTVPEDGTGSVTPGIFPSSTYRVAAPGDESGYVYSRWSNPTRAALERALADLENGSHAYAFASGLAALNAVLNLLQPGDHVVAVKDLYGGTHRQFEQLARRFGLDFSYVEGDEPSQFDAAATDRTRLIWIETPTNPLLKTVDIGAAAAVAHDHGALLGVDSTFATPFIQQPLTLDADIVLHSASKYLGGHCDVIAGALVVDDESLAERLRFNQYAVGGTLGPFEAWLILRGLKTLHLRMERHSENASAVAEYLDGAAGVGKVYFPGLDGKPLPNGMTLPGAMVSFELDGDYDAVRRLVMGTRVFTLAESLGGVESLINHPASMTHASIPKEVREANGISDRLVRLSVGLEDIDDLIDDLRQAMASAQSR